MSGMLRKYTQTFTLETINGQILLTTDKSPRVQTTTWLSPKQARLLANQLLEVSDSVEKTGQPWQPRKNPDFFRIS